MTPNCPTCGRPLSRVDIVLADRHANFECRFCWHPIHAGGKGSAERSARRATRYVAPPARKAKAA